MTDRTCPRCDGPLVRSLTTPDRWTCPGCGHTQPDNGATVIQPPTEEEKRSA